MASESARCGGIYIAHIRSEGDRLIEAVKETIAIARASGAPAEICHLKVAGQANWTKIEPLIKTIETARSDETRITADMYNYTAGSTGLDAAMPPWVQDGGLEAWITRLRDPTLRAKVIADMRDPNPTWENLYGRAGASGTQAIRKLTALPAANLSLQRRGLLQAGYFADVVVLDPATISDHATYEKPHQLSTGVEDVWINGIQALKNGVATGAASGRVVRGRAWTGAPGGGWRKSSRDWHWSK